MLFDTKIVIFVIVSLGTLGTIDGLVANVGRVFGIEFMMFFIGMFGMTVIMRQLAFIDGLGAGYKKAMKAKQDPFVFLPHGGLDR